MIAQETVWRLGRTIDDLCAVTSAARRESITEKTRIQLCNMAAKLAFDADYTVGELLIELKEDPDARRAEDHDLYSVFLADDAAQK